MRDLHNRILLCHLTGSRLKPCSVKTFVTRLNKRTLFFMNAVTFAASIIVDMVMERVIRSLKTKLKDRLGCPTQSTEAPIIKRLITMIAIQLMEGILCSEQQSTLTAERVIPAMIKALGNFEQIMSQEINQVLNDIFATLGC